MGGRGVSSGMAERSTDGVIALDKGLVDRANAAGVMVDYGDAAALITVKIFLGLEV